MRPRLGSVPGMLPYLRRRNSLVPDLTRRDTFGTSYYHVSPNSLVEVVAWSAGDPLSEREAFRLNDRYLVVTREGDKVVRCEAVEANQTSLERVLRYVEGGAPRPGGPS